LGKNAIQTKILQNFNIIIKCCGLFAHPTQLNPNLLLLKNMTRTLESINKDIKSLESAIATIADELYKHYHQYLPLLGQVMNRQFILVNYHLCTQVYADKFVKLSSSQRVNLQEQLKALVKEKQTDLINVLKTPPNQEENELFDPTPDGVIKWQEEIETSIKNNLHDLSLAANKQLQNLNLINNEMPPGLIEAASNAEGAGEITGGPPNLLHLLVEAKNNQNPEDSKVTPIVAIYLRLGEIEFTDHTLMGIRNQIRSMTGKLTNINRDYRRKTKEKTIAEAELAWRATWYED
jgi:hypothetical protein